MGCSITWTMLMMIIGIFCGAAAIVLVMKDKTLIASPFALAAIVCCAKLDKTPPYQRGLNAANEALTERRNQRTR